MVTETGCALGKHSLRQSVRIDDDGIIWNHKGIDHHITIEDVLREFEQNFGNTTWMDAAHVRIVLGECICNHSCECPMTMPRKGRRPPSNLRIEVAAFVLQAVAQQRGMTYHMTPNQDYIEIYGLPKAPAASNDC